ncbi:DUF1259 domain-containing protein [Halobacillus sp. BAB-2008]|uniref:DUF1259 domain-containing protein n=1 Tax=Halobacillus sp. BAB-2008 TaxID=1246484 RepID=UPI0002A4FBB5|nr:DUF1259 domain-containing protein [Halobacillus sp. BAB-2008]ELK45988.1 O-methyltransferase [Halobacillus sp. BAB-2008]
MPSSLCDHFAELVNGRSRLEHGTCTVSLHRTFQAAVQGRPSRAVVPVGLSFESLDTNGRALCLAEVAVLEEEIPGFMRAVVQQGLVVGALHNHWLYMNPTVMYMHIQSVEPPLDFAGKMARAFSSLSSYPVP